MANIFRGGPEKVGHGWPKMNYISNDREFNFKNGVGLLFWGKVGQQFEKAVLPPDSDIVRPHFLIRNTDQNFYFSSNFTVTILELHNNVQKK